MSKIVDKVYKCKFKIKQGRQIFMGKKNAYLEVGKMLSLISHIGITMVVSIFCTFFLGRGILDTRPIFTLISLVIGVGGAFVSVYKMVIGYTKRKWWVGY